MKFGRLSLGSARYFFHNLAFILMSCYLLADMMTGFFIIYYGVDLKISLLYKTPLYLLMLLLLANSNPRVGIAFVSLLLLSFIGPLVNFYIYADSTYFYKDIINLIKLSTVILVFLFLKELSKTDLSFFDRKTKLILLTSYIFLSINMLLGALGVGKSTYKVGEDETAGSTGLIMAGNEVGATFLVLFGYFLYNIWNNPKYRKYYLLQSVFTLMCGLVASTKTTMLAALILVFMVPLFSEREKLFKFTMLKVKIFLPLFFVVSSLVYMIVDFLERLNLLGRFLWFYEKNGVLGILLSGRDIMVSERINTYLYDSTLFQQIFGQGYRIEHSEKYMKASTEVDGVDVLGFYGLFTLILISLFYIRMLLISYYKMKRPNSIDSPIIFLISLLLLLLSQLSGHIWNSGTLAIVFGVLLSRVQLDLNNKSSISDGGKG